MLAACPRSLARGALQSGARRGFARSLRDAAEEEAVARGAIAAERRALVAPGVAFGGRRHVAGRPNGAHAAIALARRRAERLAEAGQTAAARADGCAREGLSVGAYALLRIAVLGRRARRGRRRIRRLCEGAVAGGRAARSRGDEGEEGKSSKRSHDGAAPSNERAMHATLVSRLRSERVTTLAALGTRTSVHAVASRPKEKLRLGSGTWLSGANP